MTSEFRGEQVAYVAAFTAGARLVFGDRPKDISIRWASGAAWCCLVLPGAAGDARGCLPVCQ
jgi:hypothetical protein